MEVGSLGSIEQYENSKENYTEWGRDFIRLK